ncbi:macrophage mannose receptor 1-like [Pseudophryne corroboree]|uniref:macrophage mannose receptor 1-like n=1 Tax=Pseudophryne corroboree TaxID=495146 RepID=UPI003081773F
MSSLIGCNQRHRVLAAVSGLVLILILCILCYFISKYSAATMELASLREEQRNVTHLDTAERMELASLRKEQRKLSFLGSFLIFNEEHKKCAEVRPSSTPPFELTASGCSAVSYSQFFRWLPGGRLMSTKEGLCVGVEGKPQSQKPLRLFHCDDGKSLTWVCTNETLLGVKGENLYFNYGNNKYGIVMLYWGTGPWSRWRAQSTEGKLQDGGACAQSCA